MKKGTFIRKIEISIVGNNILKRRKVMFKKVLFSVIVLSICSSILSAGNLTRLIEFSKSDITFTHQNGYDIASMDGTGFTFKTGAPLLPQKSISLLIPADAVVTAVEAIGAETDTIPGKYNIFPSQRPQPISFSEGRVSTEKDEEIYRSSSPYPRMICKKAGEGSMAGYRIVNLFVYPLQYLPQKKRLIFNRKIKIRVGYTARDSKMEVSPLQKKYFGSIIKDLVLNPQDIKRFSPGIRSSFTSNVLSPDTVEYVVITSQGLITGFQPLCDWQTEKGIPARIVTTDWIYANYSGLDNADKVRNFIKDAAQNWLSIWFLLGGDADDGSGIIVPRRDVYCLTTNVGACPDEDTIPSDMYFSNLGGTWDGNNNGVYGEMGDNVDLYPDVFVGRAPVHNLSDCSIFVNNTLEYENPQYPDYFEKVLLPSQYLFGSNYGYYTNDTIAAEDPASFFDCKMYQEYGHYHSMEMIDSLNQGYNYVHIAGHGNIDRVMAAGDDPITSSMIDNYLSAGQRLSVLTGICCLSGAFDYDCFAEHLLLNPNGGAVASILNSRFGWGRTVPPPLGASNQLDIQFFRELFSNKHHFAEAEQAAKVYYVSYASTDTIWRWCYYDQINFGDPELSLWTAKPENMTVAYTPVVIVGTDTVQVSVTDTLGSPLSNVLVCTSMDSTVYVRGTTNSAGQVNLIVSPVHPGQMVICVTKHNYIPFIDSILVVSPGPYLSYLSHSIDDTVSGNGNGIPEFGETIVMPTWIINYGNSAAGSVTGKLSSSDTFVVITVDSQFFGHIPAHDSILTPVGYGFGIRPDVDNGHTVSFNLHIQDSLINTWDSPFNITVYAPVLTYKRHVIDDGENGIFEPGETVNLIVYIANSGGASLESASAILSCSSSYITIGDSTASFGSIAPGDTAANLDSLVVTASSSTPLAYPAHFSLRITGERGFQTTLDFIVLIGRRDFLIWDPDPDHSSGPVLKTSLETAGYTGDYTTALGGYADSLSGYKAVFVFCGIYNQKYTIQDGSTEAGALVSYLEQGGRLYIEGGDLWYYDPLFNNGYDFNNLFGIIPIADGAGDLDTLSGEPATFTEGMVFSYTGENAYIDRLSATGTGFSIFRNGTPDYVCAVANDEGSYRTVGASFEFGGLSDGDKTALADSIVHFFGRAGVKEKISSNNKPIRFFLSQNTPNPSSRFATVRFAIPQDTHVSLRVYDVTGRMVKEILNKRMKKGIYSVRLKTAVLSAGIYFYRLTSLAHTKTKKMIVLK